MTLRAFTGRAPPRGDYSSVRPQPPYEAAAPLLGVAWAFGPGALHTLVEFKWNIDDMIGEFTEKIQQVEFVFGLSSLHLL